MKDTSMTLTLPLSGLAVSLTLVTVSCIYAQDAAAGDAEQTMIASVATISGLTALDTPAAVSVNIGDDIRHVAPRINIT